MSAESRREANQTVYRRLKDGIDRQYPPGHVVAIHDGRIVADADSFDELDRRLNEMGMISREILVAEAGAELPEMTWILLESFPGRSRLEPRHREIPDFTARRICKQLGIPGP